jgi:hypothetical protein
MFSISEYIWAISRVNVELKTSVSEISTVSIIRVDPDIVGRGLQGTH